MEAWLAVNFSIYGGLASCEVHMYAGLARCEFHDMYMEAWLAVNFTYMEA